MGTASNVSQRRQLLKKVTQSPNIRWQREVLSNLKVTPRHEAVNSIGQVALAQRIFLYAAKGSIAKIIS